MSIFILNNVNVSKWTFGFIIFSIICEFICATTSIVTWYQQLVEQAFSELLACSELVSSTTRVTWVNHSWLWHDRTWGYDNFFWGEESPIQIYRHMMCIGWMFGFRIHKPARWKLWTRAKNIRFYDPRWERGRVSVEVWPPPINPDHRRHPPAQQPAPWLCNCPQQQLAKPQRLRQKQ